jgi:hypothetical protein
MTHTARLLQNFGAMQHVQRATIPNARSVLVGEQLHRIRNGKTERLGGLEIDDQLELGRRLICKIGSLLALKNAIY